MLAIDWHGKTTNFELVPILHHEQLRHSNQMEECRKTKIAEKERSHTKNNENLFLYRSLICLFSNNEHQCKFDNIDNFYCSYLILSL